MRKFKVCLLGSFAVGKTSLVSRFVSGTFSDRYQTSVGVRVQLKHMPMARDDVKLLVWDIHGEDDLQAIRLSYLRGASGCLYVVDPSRPATLVTAARLMKRVRSAIGETPALVLLNKSDRKGDWDLTADDVRARLVDDVRVIETSAKTGQGVRTAFRGLTQDMLESTCPTVSGSL